MRRVRGGNEAASREAAREAKVWTTLSTGGRVMPPSSVPNNMWGARDKEACRLSADNFLFLGFVVFVVAPYL